MQAEARDETPEYHPLQSALAAQGKLWPEPRLDVGALAPGWITTAALFADDAAIDDHLAYQGSFNEGADAKSRAAFLLSDYCAMFTVSSVPLLVGAGVVPDFAPTRFAMQFYLRRVEHDGQSAELRRAHVRFLSPAFASDRESATDHPDAQPLPDRTGLCDRFRESVEAHFVVVIDALQRRTGLPKSAMWRLVGDALAVGFLDAGRRYDRLPASLAMAEAVLKHDGSPLKNRQMHFCDVTVCDAADPDRVLACHTFRARGGCCRYYRIPGGKLCSTCVLHDAATRERLLQNVMRRRLGLPAA